MCNTAHFWSGQLIRCLVDKQHLPSSSAAAGERVCFLNLNFPILHSVLGANPVTAQYCLHRQWGAFAPRSQSTRSKATRTRDPACYFFYPTVLSFLRLIWYSHRSLYLSAHQKTRNHDLRNLPKLAEGTVQLTFWLFSSTRRRNLQNKVPSSLRSCSLPMLSIYSILYCCWLLCTGVLTPAFLV